MKVSNSTSRNNRSNLRFFEHSVYPQTNIDKSKQPFDNAEISEARQFYYKTLMQVFVYHDFYNTSNNECGDFIFYPTSDSLELMRNLGLLFKQVKTGFSILYNDKASTDLIGFLKRQGDGEGNAESYWTRLSFFAVENNPLFVNFTDVSIETNSAKKNFYLTNLQAHSGRKDENIILNKRNYTSQITQSYYPIVPVQYEVDFKVNYKDKIINSTKIKVFDISGTSVICLPQSVPLGLVRSKNIQNLDCFNVKKYLDKYPDARCVEREMAYINFYTLPYGHYIIRWYTANNLMAQEEKVVYTQTFPSPLCFIDLFFSRPQPDEKGVYPIFLQNDTSESGVFESETFEISTIKNKVAKNILIKNKTVEDSVVKNNSIENDSRKNSFINPVKYHLNFKRRSTYWVYWIVLRSLPIDNLDILSERSEMIQFKGPYEGRLANGQSGWYFVSESPLPLQQRSQFRFKLVGQLNNDELVRTFINPLPVASAGQVLTKKFCNIKKSLRDNHSKNAIYSEIYVYV